ncbi:hypothetical protein BDQ17DRAFT_1430594 [Cyathus striatus]|nr:hypothetical protein BDQ17DRAFT_1430594 [Cyathus striatus]
MTFEVTNIDFLWRRWRPSAFERRHPWGGKRRPDNVCSSIPTTVTDAGVIPGETVTLVEASNYASAGEIIGSGTEAITLGAICTISGAAAACSIADSESTYTTIESVSSVAVQLGSTAALAAVTPAPSANVSASGTGLTTVRSSQSSGSSSASPTSTSNSSGAPRELNICGKLYTILMAIIVTGAVSVA